MDDFGVLDHLCPSHVLGEFNAVQAENLGMGADDGPKGLEDRHILLKVVVPASDIRREGILHHPESRVEGWLALLEKEGWREIEVEDGRASNRVGLNGEVGIALLDGQLDPLGNLRG